MNPSRLFILRPVATSLLMIAILVAGVVAYRFLPVSSLPDVEYPTIQVQTFYPGASPEVMTSSVTAPLERQLGEMSGLDQMSSASSAGASTITLRFALDLSMDTAQQEVQAAINAAGNLLPSDLPAPPVYAKINPADAPIMTLGVTSPTMSLVDLENLVQTRLASKLSEVAGVGLVEVEGGNVPSVRVRVNPRAMAARGLNLDDLRTTIGQINVNSPKGSFDGPSQSVTIQANDQISSASQYADAVIAYRNGAPVHLKDVADVVEAAENAQLGAWIDRTPAIVVDIQRQPGANVIRTVNAIRALLPTLRQAIPASVSVTPLVDRTATIRASVSDVEFELALAIGLVVLVIFLFLRNLPATLVPSLSVPLSLIGTLAIMYLAGFSLDNLSLMALTVSTGFVVDDAIVMIENIARYVEAGERPLEAALRGSAQIGFTIVSLTVSLIAVLIPLLFMGDVVGRLFHEFAITLAVTIVISALVSLTLVPMLCARVLRPLDEARETRLGRWNRLAFDRMIGFYDRTLGLVLAWRGITLAVFLLTVAATVLLYVVIPKGFFPVQDTGLIQAVTQAPQSISYPAMAAAQARLAAAVLTDPDVTGLTSYVGVDGSNTTLNSGRMLISLRPRDARTLSASAIIRRIGREVAGIPGISLYMQPVQDLTIDTSVSPTQYQFVLEDPNGSDFDEYVPKLVAELQALPELADVASSLQQAGLTVTLEIDRQRAARFGITPATVDSALYDAFGQRIVSTIYTQTNQYRVILEADPTLQKSLASLGSIYLPSSSGTGAEVPLSEIVTLHTGTDPLVVQHLGEFPATTVSFNLAPGVALGTAVDAIRQAELAIGLPKGMFTSFQGSALAFQATLGNEILLVLAALLAVYIVLGVLYESFIHPLTILSTLPSAGVGALLSLMLAGSDLDVIGIIGIVLLIGIVKKNAIMMIDFALDAERRLGMDPLAAIRQACLLRFRPILMTTLAAMLGALPLMLGSGAGSELRRPLGIAIVGGLALSQVLTLYTTPVIYLAFDGLARRVRRRFAPRPQGEPA